MQKERHNFLVWVFGKFIPRERRTDMKSLLAVLMAVVASMGLVVVPAFAADRLIVKDAGGTNTVFVVQDTGYTGIGTPTPTADLVINAKGTNPRGIISAQHSTNAWAAMSTFMKSRGTETAPTSVQTGDYIGFVVNMPHDGASYLRAGGFGFRVDGPVSAGSVPVALDFITGTGGGGGTTYGPERMTISSSGTVKVHSLAGTYTGGSAYVCVNNSGVIYASEAACP